VCELLGAGFEVIAVLGLHCILDSTWDGVVSTKNSALSKLDLSRHATLQSAPGGHGTTAWLLSRSPILY
jgi:hypothetical protein